MTNRQSQLQLLVIDPDRSGKTNHQLAPLMFLPHLLSQVIADAEEAGQTLQILVDEMHHRLKHETIRPTIVTLIDNAEVLTGSGSEDVQAALATLLQRGAEAGIHLVLSSSVPSAGWLSSVMRANLPLRLVGQVRDEAESLAATAVVGAEADYLLGEGDFLAVADGSQVHFQAAFIGNYDLHLTLETIHRNRPRPLLAQPLEAFDASEEPELLWQRDDETADQVMLPKEDDDADLFEGDLQED
jgi:DNA segregation ATPase FtsK/SpoIIIE-like protein